MAAHLPAALQRRGLPLRARLVSAARALPSTAEPPTSHSTAEPPHLPFHRYVLPELCLVLLTPKADGFPEVTECRAQVVSRLEQQDEFRASILACLAQPQCAASSPPRATRLTTVH